MARKHLFRKRDDRQGLLDARTSYAQAQSQIDGARRSGIELYQKTQGTTGFNDTNYIFLSFVTKYFPVGVVGLVIAVIFILGKSPPIFRRSCS